MKHTNFNWNNKSYRKCFLTFKLNISQLKIIINLWLNYTFYGYMENCIVYPCCLTCDLSVENLCCNIHTNMNNQLSMQKYWACHDVIVFNICICPQRRAQRLITETLFYKGHILSQQLCLTLYESEQHCKIDSAHRNKRPFVLSAFYL